MHVRLIPVPQTSFETAIDVSEPRFMIGRADGCDLRLTNSWVSRYHCEIVIDGDEVCARDLASSNGTFVNNESVADERVLQDGDVLNVACIVYVVEIHADTLDVTHMTAIGCDAYDARG